jgi:putative ABC transport system substrate-binding protein
MMLDYRSADGRVERYPPLARELIDQQCDVIFTLGTEPTIPFCDVGYPRPVVFLAVDADPLDRKLVTGLRSPGVNATGVYIPHNALVGKRLEMIRDVVPDIRRLLVVSDIATRALLRPMRMAAAHANVQLTIVEFTRHPYDYDAAFVAGSKAAVQGVMLLPSPVFSTDRKALAAIIEKRRLPSVAASVQMVEAGLLASIHADNRKMTRRAAEMGVRILRGSRPADLAVEQADEIELVINAKVAKALGVRIPESMMARATRIVQ